MPRHPEGPGRRRSRRLGHRHGPGLAPRHEGRPNCAAATTTNAFRDDAPRRAARSGLRLVEKAKVAPELRKDWDATIELGQNDVVETPTTNETAEDAAGDVLMQLVSTGSLVAG